MGIAAGLGIAAFTFDSVDGFWRWIEMAEDSDIDSIWQTDRQVSREPILESMTALAAVAGATKRLKFGVNVASLGFRDPLLLAKQCATIDFLSNGRMLPAFGLGSARSRDWQATGRDTAARGRRMNECLEIVSTLWRGEAVEMKGEFYSYDHVVISPLPVQKRMPLWIGGSSQAAFERTGKYGTGWQAASETPELARVAVDAIQAAAKKHGRTIDEDHFGGGFAFRFGSWDDAPVERAAKGYKLLAKRDPAQGLAVGGAKEIIEKIEAYVAAGLAKFVLRPIADDDAGMLEQTRLLIDEVLPEVKAIDRRWRAARAA